MYEQYLGNSLDNIFNFEDYSAVTPVSTDSGYRWMGIMQTTREDYVAITQCYWGTNIPIIKGNQTLIRLKKII